MSKAVFFDRDGTIIIDKHYLHKTEDVEFFTDTLEALKLIDQKGYLKFIVTNQSGVGRGYFPEEDILVVHQFMQKQLQANGVKPFDDIEYCPDTPSCNSLCRKPSPLMIETLAKRWNIDLSKSYMIGDKSIDAEAGINAGCQGLMIHTPSEEHQSFQSLTQFADSLK